MNRAHILICGGGIVGLTIARELVARGHENIVVIEKEDQPGAHASGRNSGVLHAGVYYEPNTLKAQVCLKGNRKMAEYCRSRNLPLGETKKVIVAKNESELPTLHSLYERSTANGAKVEMLEASQVTQWEPNAKTHKEAMLSHYTAVIDPMTVLRSILEELTTPKPGAQSAEVRVEFGTRFEGRVDANTIRTNRGEIQFDRMINCAGAFADRIAHAFDLGTEYRLIPFKGTYKKLRADKAHLFNGSIYPVPNIDNPFLGVHFTKNIKGDVYIGPTAIPAFGRENYGFFDGLSLESLDIAIKDAMLFLTNKGFRQVALEEPKKYRNKAVFDHAKDLVRELEPDWIIGCGKVGIRPQLVDWAAKELIMDFLVVENDETVHVLNAVSPAFTGSLEFACHIVDNYIDRTASTSSADSSSAGPASTEPCLSASNR